MLAEKKFQLKAENLELIVDCNMYHQMTGMHKKGIKEDWSL